MRTLHFILASSTALALAIVSAGCGGGDTGGNGGHKDTGGAGGGGTGCNGVELTVKNYLSWCSLTVNGGTASAAASETVCVPANSTVDLDAVAGTGFILGPKPWHDTAGDKGSGDPGKLTGSGTSASDATTVKVTTGKACVWACCPFPAGTGCPTTDQCP